MEYKLTAYLLCGVGLTLSTWWILDWLPKTYRFQVFGKMVSHIKTNERVVALTYDDGPNPPHTNNLLNVLREFQAKATFFTIGQNLEKHPEAARRAISEGHELGNHSYSHAELVGKAVKIVRSEIDKTDQLLNELGLQTDIHFRAPLGLKRFRLPWELARRQKVNILWNVDPKDYMGKSPEKIANFVVENVEPGSIVLMHDGGGDRSHTVEATRLILKQLQEKGYQFKTVSELMAQQL